LQQVTELQQQSALGSFCAVISKQALCCARDARVTCGRARVLSQVPP
jgi:hypothetical protein